MQNGSNPYTGKIKAIPWHLITQLAKNGHSVPALATKFGVSADRIQKRLNVALTPDGKVRTALEIKTASEQIKADLVSALQRLTSQLANKDQISASDIPALQKLTESAARLFAWPNAKAIDSSASFQAALPVTHAVNLQLIRTTPEQLRQAKAIDASGDSAA